MALSNVVERIERTLYRVLYQVAVDEGFWPNEDLLINLPNGQQLLEQQIDQIIATKGFAVEVFGMGSSQAKGLKRVPRIVLISRRSMPGMVGSSAVQHSATSDPELFLKTLGSTRSSDLQIEVNVVSNTAQQDRIINAITIKALGVMRHMLIYGSTDEWFCIEQYTYYDLPETIEGIMEKSYGYQIHDIFVDEQAPVGTVHKIDEIKVEVTVGDTKDKDIDLHI